MSETDHATNSEAIEIDDFGIPLWFKHFQKWFLRRTWFVHPGAHLRLSLTPSETYKVLEIAAKPSVDRLHYRNLFARGRRYFLAPRLGGGFRMMTTHKVPWYPRRRSSTTAILTGNFDKVDDDTTRLTLSTRIKIDYLVQVFFLPTFMTSMVVFMAWNILIIIACIIALYGLSWMGHRYNAALEAYEMIFFIEAVLENYIPDPPQSLPPSIGAGDVILESGFAEEWDKFVDEMQDS